MKVQDSANYDSRILGRSRVLGALGWEICKGFGADYGQRYRVCSAKERRLKMRLASTVLGSTGTSF